MKIASPKQDTSISTPGSPIQSRHHPTTQPNQTYTNLASPPVTQLYARSTAGSSAGGSGMHPAFTVARTDNIFHAFTMQNRAMESAQSSIGSLSNSLNFKHEQQDMSYRELFRRRAGLQLQHSYAVHSCVLQLRNHNQLYLTDNRLTNMKVLSFIMMLP